MRWTRCAQQTSAPGADGEVVWSCCLDAGINLVTMLRIAPGTETRKPDLRGEHEGNRKTIRAGNAGTYPANL